MIGTETGAGRDRISATAAGESYSDQAGNNNPSSDVNDIQVLIDARCICVLLRTYDPSSTTTNAMRGTKPQLRP